MRSPEERLKEIAELVGPSHYLVVHALVSRRISVSETQEAADKLAAAVEKLNELLATCKK